PFAALGAGDDAFGFQLLVDATAGGVLDGGGTAHGPARAVAGCAGRLLHAPRLAHQHPAGPAHIARNDHPLADPAIHPGHLGVLRRKAPRRPLAVPRATLSLAADGVLLEFRDIVAHIVDQVHLQFLPRTAEDFGKYLASLGHEELAIAPGEVGSRTHGGD